MLKLDALATFVAVVETGSLGRAARRLGLSSSVVSERLKELERSLDATLVRRTTRNVSVTQEGRAFADRARRIVREVAEASAEIVERRGELAGPLRVAAPVSFGTLHLGPALYGFLARHPKVELTLDVDDRLINMAADGYDAIVRHGPMADEQIIVKRLALSRRSLVASPAYLGSHGTPSAVDDLKRHRGIVYSNRGAADWRFKVGRKLVSVRPASVALRVNNGILMRDAAAAGLGLALLPRWFVPAELASNRLTIVDVGAEPEGATLYVAYPRDRRDSAKVRALTDWLRAAFGNPPYWEA